jgi:KamA family protein
MPAFSETDRSLVPNQSGQYQAYNLSNYRSIPQLDRLTESQIEAIEVVGRVLPFKTNTYVVNHIIDWDRVPNDPMFRLTFPQRDMLLPHHYEQVYLALKRGAGTWLDRTVARIRTELNPHPAGQTTDNIPVLEGRPVPGIQHKYPETVLFFPSQGQTCHAYCTFCFRWPQFVATEAGKFASSEIETLIAYLRAHPRVTSVLFTGGDPLVMKTAILRRYVSALVGAKLPNLRTIRFGTKSLSYWPERFLDAPDADDLLRLFEETVQAGIGVAFMAHFNHPVELSTNAVRRAVRRINATGAVIRTQSPLLRGINDDPNLWSEMWREQVGLGMIPYYMFLVRDTGASHYFGVPLVEANEIYTHAYRNVSGLARTVRGPSMSAHFGKIQVLGPVTIDRRRLLALQFIQGRNPEWVGSPFFAEYNAEAQWIDDLKPAFGGAKFFFEEPSRYSEWLAKPKGNRECETYAPKPTPKSRIGFPPFAAPWQ